MRRKDVEREMQELTGGVLSLLDRVPDELVDPEWQLFKRLVLDDSLISGRCKGLIGVAVAAAIRCPHAVRLHTELARAYGASEAELAEAVQMAGQVVAWGVRMSGLQVDAADFAAEVDKVVRHVSARIGVDA